MKRSRPLHIVVPFASNKNHVASINAALLKVADELIQLSATVFFYVNSDHSMLGSDLSHAALAWPSNLITVVPSNAPASVAEMCNRAFASAIEEDADVILLTPEAIVMPGALPEMVAVARLDPMTGFVSPRSNDAWLASLPHARAGHNASMQQAFANFTTMSHRLPRAGFVPSISGFALWIDGRVLAELGGFDTSDAFALSVVHDLIMRANRCGYRAVLANHAFVWRNCEASPTWAIHTSEPSLRERYAEYDALINRYLSSATWRAEALIESLPYSDNAFRITFDLSSFDAHYNGTFEAGLRLLAAAEKTWPSRIKLGAYMSEEAWTFHRMERFPRVERLELEGAEPSAAILRIGQPFTSRDIARMYTHAPVVGVFMLDTIAFDCGYLSLEFDPEIWSFVFDESDVLFTNSDYTLGQIRRRFNIGVGVVTCVSRHSLDIADYAPQAQATTSSGESIFVVGNRYEHKFIGPTVDAIAEALPDRMVIAVGYPQTRPPPSNVEAYSAGKINDVTFERFYANAKVVVFPSHYEGFGFPIMHALARHKPIFVRDTALNHELACRIAQAANIHFYDTTAALVRMLHNLPAWSDTIVGGETNGWERSALEVYKALDTAMNRADVTRVASKLRRIDATAVTVEEQLASLPRGHRLALRFGPTLDRFLNASIVKHLRRAALLLRKRLRTLRAR